MFFNINFIMYFSLVLSIFYYTFPLSITFHTISSGFSVFIKIIDLLLNYAQWLYLQR